MGRWGHQPRVLKYRFKGLVTIKATRQVMGDHCMAGYYPWLRFHGTEGE